MNGPDKRQMRRKTASLVFELTDAEGLLLIGFGRLVDVSAGGALLETRQALEKGQSIRLRVRLEDRSRLDLLAEVVRSQPKPMRSVFLHGISFTNSVAAEIERLNV